LAQLNYHGGPPEHFVPGRTIGPGWPRPPQKAVPPNKTPHSNPLGLGLKKPLSPTGGGVSSAPKKKLPLRARRNKGNRKRRKKERKKKDQKGGKKGKKERKKRQRKEKKNRGREEGGRRKEKEEKKDRKKKQKTENLPREKKVFKCYLKNQPASQGANS